MLYLFSFNYSMKFDQPYLPVYSPFPGIFFRDMKFASQTQYPSKIAIKTLTFNDERYELRNFNFSNIISIFWNSSSKLETKCARPFASYIDLFFHQLKSKIVIKLEIPLNRKSFFKKICLPQSLNSAASERYKAKAKIAVKASILFILYDLESELFLDKKNGFDSVNERQLWSSFKRFTWTELDVLNRSEFGVATICNVLYVRHHK